MFIQFDKKSLHIQVICGILEKFEPTEEITELQAKLEALKKEVEEFQDKVLNPKLKELDEIVVKLNGKKD